MSAETAGGHEVAEDLAQALVADAELFTEVGSRYGPGSQGGHDALSERVGLRVRQGFGFVDEAEMGVWLTTEFDTDGLRGGYGAVLGVQFEASLPAQQVEAGVGPCVEVARATQGLSGLVGTGLSHVVDEHDGHAMLTLELAEVVEQPRDVAGRVLVGAVQPDEGIEHEQPGAEPLDGGGEPQLVLGAVEAQVVDGDESYGEPLQVVDAPAVGDGGDAVFDCLGRVFGGVQQHGSTLADGEASQAGSAAGDGDGEFES